MTGVCLVCIKMRLKKNSRNVLQKQAVVDQINKTHLRFPLAAVNVTVKPKPLMLRRHSGLHGFYS